MMEKMNNDEIRQVVREKYGQVGGGSGGCGCTPAQAGGCCGAVAPPAAAAASLALGYSIAEISAAPEGANLGLGCGNPQALASLGLGERVLDLGSGAGFDCFLASVRVGAGGKVIGVDMTPEMVSKARANAAKGGYGNVEFRLGEIEHLPVGDETVDVVMSNCVVNLSPEKAKVFREAFRVLKPGGRLAIADVVALAPLSDEVRNDLALYAGCIAGASSIAEIEAWLLEAGFTEIRIGVKEGSREIIDTWFPGWRLGDQVASATVEAKKGEA